MPIGPHRTALFAKWLQSTMVLSDIAQGAGDRWFVDPSNTRGGATAGFGVSPDKPFTTMAAAIANCSAGDIIFLMSDLAEGGLTLAKNHVQIIGIGGRGPMATHWMETAPDQTLLIVTGQHCALRNIRFRIPTFSAGTPMGLSLSGAYELEIEDCQFTGRTGSYYGINSDGTSDNVAIRRCKFMYINTATHGTAIRGHTYAADHSGWLIEDCIFHSNLKHIECAMRQSVIRNCQFAEIGVGPGAGAALTATVKIDISGGSMAKWNLVTGCMLPGDYSNVGGYVAALQDNWTGNFADDVAEAGVGDNGITIGLPA